MQIIKQNVVTVMNRLNFPVDAQGVFVEALERISLDSVACACLKQLIKKYEMSEAACDYNSMIADMDAMGRNLGIHEHTMDMLLFLCLCEPLRVRYVSRKIDEAVWLNSIMDLKYKLEECCLVYGTVGTFVARWYAGFFDMTRFALGRLQFEIVYTKNDYIVGGIEVPKGSPAINVHIPRTETRLDHNDVLNSYIAAANWFSDVFQNGEVLFTCNSWLLDPCNLTVLKPSSNLAAFMGDFEIVETYLHEGYPDLWRLFDCNYNGNPEDLPRNSSLRRAYADRVARAEKTGGGRGFFRMKNGEILK